MSLTDTENSYLFKAYLYVGKDTDGIDFSKRETKKLSKPTQSVLRLPEPIMGSHRNITVDNWFTSIKLVENLKGKGRTLVPSKTIEGKYLMILRHPKGVNWAFHLTDSRPT